MRWPLFSDIRLTIANPFLKAAHFTTTARVHN